MAAIYQADVWCNGCADLIQERVASELWSDRFTAVCPDGTPVAEFDLYNDLVDYLNLMDGWLYDSGDYPKGCNDDEESDCPQHCAAGADCCEPEVCSDGSKYGYFFGNPLTIDGEDYVKEAVNKDRRAGRDDSPACELWAPCYDYIDFGDKWACPYCDNKACITDQNDYVDIGVPYCADCDCEMDRIN